MEIEERKINKCGTFFSWLITNKFESISLQETYGTVILKCGNIGKNKELFRCKNDIDIVIKRL